MRVVGVETQVVHFVILQTAGGDQVPISVSREEAEAVQAILRQENRGVTAPPKTLEATAEDEEANEQLLLEQLRLLDEEQSRQQGPMGEEEAEAPAL